MSIDKEILQEFLIEAGELYEQLNDQLVMLEQKPRDSELLNAIFRAFHTIKGGAGFMKLQPLVDVCHGTEDIINLLRQDKIQISAELIDVLLKVIDIVGNMFDKVRAGEELQSADPEFLAHLNFLSGGNDNNNNLQTEDSADVTSSLEGLVHEELEKVSADDEFEALLDAAISDSAVSPAPNSEMITEDEFEKVLDELHGKGKHSQLINVDKKDDSKSDEITPEEFEAVLDELYGKNKGPGKNSHVNKPGIKTKESSETSSGIKNNTNVKSEEVTKKPGTTTTTISAAETSVRVDTSRLDEIMNLVGELVLVRNRLSTLKIGMNQNNVIDSISNLERVTSDLQASVMKTRMQPIKKVFSRFPRVIRDLARQLDKDVSLELSGEDTDLDKSLVEALADPLVHLVRNAVDHGIETPEQRFAAGKARQGMILLGAKQQGDQILLSVCDDGKGMDHKLLRKKAVEKGLMNQEAADNLTDEEAFNLIFAPGFSTKSEISDVSGRGVGMDVVKTRISELNGRIEIDSELGKGSVITIRLPLTLAILSTLMVTLEGYQFALPLSNVNESFNIEADNINSVDGQEIMRVREKPLPLFYLKQWLINGNEINQSEISQKVIVVQMRNQQFCLVVDNILGQEEVVIKPLGAMLYKTPGFSGATITGDGGIALILDVPGLIDAYASSY